MRCGGLLPPTAGSMAGRKLRRGGQAAVFEDGNGAEEGEAEAEGSRQNLLAEWEHYFPERRWEEYSDEEIRDMVQDRRWAQREARQEEQAEAEANAPGLPAGRTLRVALGRLTQLTSLELQVDSQGEPLVT